jgi:hypothetical protein
MLQTTVRTVQRDILFFKAAGFPVKEVARGMYALDKSLLKNFEIFDDTELALVVALKNLVLQLGQPFQNAADGLFNRLYDVVMSEPVFVKIDEAVPLGVCRTYSSKFCGYSKCLRCLTHQHSRYDVAIMLALQ